MQKCQGGLKIMENKHSAFVKNYFESTAERHKGIGIDNNMLAGMPTINGRRIPVSLILSCLKDNMSIEEICSQYLLTEKDIKNALDFAAGLLDYPFQADVGLLSFTKEVK
jgi:uncharacterized protein (DUF433 family)